MYSKAAEDEDNKMADRWQKDADGILIFVSLRVGISSFLSQHALDRFILCCRCCATRRNSPESDPQ